MQFFTLHIVSFDGAIEGAEVERSHWQEAGFAHDHAEEIMQFHPQFKGDWKIKYELQDFKENPIKPKNQVGPFYVSPWLHGHYIMYVTREVLQ